MTTDIKEAVDALEAKLAEKVGQYEQQVSEHGDAVKSLKSDLKALTEEHAQLVKELPEQGDRLKAVEQLLAEGTKGGGDADQRSWGGDLVESEGFKSFASGGTTKARVEVKNTILGEAGSPGEPSDAIVARDRLPGIVPGAFRALNVLDFVPTGVTGSNQIVYTREASYTNSAAGTEEGAEKPESALTFELIDDPVRTIAHWIKASKQILDDSPALASYIDRRLAHGVRQKLQSEIIKGTGTSPAIAGLSASGRHTAFTPETGENALDAVNRAKYAVIGADYDPTFVLMNPADWGGIERLKRGSSDDSYLASDGQAISYINGGMTPMLWGLPVVVSNDVASGKFYVADSAAFQLFMRQGVMVEMSDSDDDNFTKNLLTIRAELRAAMAVYTPTAVRYGDLTQ